MWPCISTWIPRNRSKKRMAPFERCLHTDVSSNLQPVMWLHPKSIRMQIRRWIIICLNEIAMNWRFPKFPNLQTQIIWFNPHYSWKLCFPMILRDIVAIEIYPNLHMSYAISIPTISRLKSSLHHTTYDIPWHLHDILIPSRSIPLCMPTCWCLNYLNISIWLNTHLSVPLNYISMISHYLCFIVSQSLLWKLYNIIYITHLQYPLPSGNLT